MAFAATADMAAAVTAAGAFGFLGAGELFGTLVFLL